MNIHAALILARTELERWPELVGWRITVSSRMNRALGKCRYRSKTIQLSPAHVQLNDAEKVRETVLHEIAHALVGPGHGHDHVWRAMAVKVGAKPVRCDHDAAMPSGKWVAVCPSCRQQFHLFRKPKTDRIRWCRACGPKNGLLTYAPNQSRP